MGATKILPTHRPKVLIEAHAQAPREACTDTLRAAAYDVRWIEPNTVWLRDAVMPGRGWLAAWPSAPTSP